MNTDEHRYRKGERFDWSYCLSLCSSVALSSSSPDGDPGRGRALPSFAPAFSPPRKSLEDICSERSSSENGVSMYRFWKHVYRGHPVYRLPGYRYFAPPGKAGQMSSGEGLREFREVSQGEFHEGVRAVQVELLTDVAAMRFDGVVTDE